MAAVRATREGTVSQGRETLPVIIGTPLDGETIGGETFDGKTETAIFPGDLPSEPDALFSSRRGAGRRGRAADPLRPLPAAASSNGRPTALTLSLPHIRLDRALQFLIGDRLA